MCIKANLAGSRQHSGQERESRLRAGDGEQKSDGSARTGEKRALREKLADHAPLARPQRRANGELARPADGAREQEVRDVRARDQQQKTDRGEQHQQEGPHIADDVLFHGHERDPEILVGHRIGRREIAGDGVHLGLRLRESHARFQAADCVRADVDGAIAKRDVVPPADGGVDVPLRSIEREVRGDHPHHGIWRAVEHDHTPQHGGGRPEPALPEPAAEQDGRSSAEPVVGSAEVAADDRRLAERAEEIRGDHGTAEALRLVRAGEVVVLIAVDGHRRERLRHALPVEEIQVADRPFVESRRVVVDGGELAGVGIGERVEQHAVDDGEERGVRADAEREGEHGGRREAGRLEQHANRVAQIVQQCAHASLRFERPVRRLTADVHRISPRRRPR